MDPAGIQAAPQATQPTSQVAKTLKVVSLRLRDVPGMTLVPGSSASGCSCKGAAARAKRVRRSRICILLCVIGSRGDVAQTIAGHLCQDQDRDRRGDEARYMCNAKKRSTARAAERRANKTRLPGTSGMRRRAVNISLRAGQTIPEALTEAPAWLPPGPEIITESHQSRFTPCPADSSITVKIVAYALAQTVGDGLLMGLSA
jgi:hypothetical protein